jgi:kynurenine 3-monooxygenase
MARRAVIVGAGLGGCLLAHFLGQRGWRVDVFERRGDPRAAGFVGGRSINLAISARGLHALARAGLDAEVREHGIRMPGRMLHARDGRTAFVPYSADPSRAIVSFGRSALNLMLLRAAAAHPGVALHFGRRCVGLDEAAGAAQFDDGSAHAADLVVGADGAFSAVRAHLMRRERFDYSQATLAHGYKELRIPPVSSGPHAPFAMEPHALHIWPRGGGMMIALPNPDGSFTCTLFWPFDDPSAPGARAPGAASPAFATVRTGAEARALFAREYPDALALMPTLEEDFARNPVGTMVTVRCWPWTAAGRFALLGDAAHAIVPFYGQGANASFEDCEALVDALERHGDAVPAALAEYERARKPNADAIADMALANFVEMRDGTARLAFRVRKRVDHWLNRLLPRAFVPLYDLVSFTTVPYAEARERARRQDRWVRAGGAVAGLCALAAVAAGAVWAARRLG